MSECEQCETCTAPHVSARETVDWGRARTSAIENMRSVECAVFRCLLQRPPQRVGWYHRSRMAVQLSQTHSLTVSLFGTETESPYLFEKFETSGCNNKCTGCTVSLKVKQSDKQHRTCRGT